MAIIFSARLVLAFFSVLSLPSLTRAHIELVTPPGINSKFDPQTLEANIDYSMTSPLLADGSNYPCKGYGTAANIANLNPVATLTAGSNFGVTMAGTATHEGGSCQFSVSYDQGKTFAVIASIIGGCPISLAYIIPVPSNLPSGRKALFSWTWFNYTGNREMYQNCAVVDIVGKPGVTTFTGPKPYRANTFADGACTTDENVDIVFPNPGQVVFYGGNEKPGAALTKLDNCPYQENVDVTITSSGGSEVTSVPITTASVPVKHHKAKGLSKPVTYATSTSRLTPVHTSSTSSPSPSTVNTDDADDQEFAEAKLICTSSKTFSLCSSPVHCTPMGSVAAGTICQGNAIVEDPNRFAAGSSRRSAKRVSAPLYDVRRSRSIVAHQKSSREYHGR